MKILYFSSVPFGWLKQRPQFLAEAFGFAGHQVTYCCVTPLGRRTYRGKSRAPLTQKEYRLLPGALLSRWVRFINRFILRCTLFREDYDAVILTHPVQWAYLPKRKGWLLCYECMDVMPEFYKGKQKKEMEKLEEALCKTADCFVTSSGYLKKELERKYQVSGAKIQVVYNALSEEWIRRRVKAVPLAHPNLMYLGTIAEWFDYQTVNGFARKHPEYTIYLIGANGGSTPGLAENVHFMGPVPHEAVLAYMYSADALLLPFVNSPLVYGVDPVKLYEAVGLGKPVISSYWPELERFRGWVRFYTNEADFEEQALGVAREQTSLNEEFIQKNNWNERARQFEQWLKKFEKLRGK